MRVKVGDLDWARYSRIISTFMDEDAAKQPITYAQANTPYQYGEDNGITYNKVELKGLLTYNSFRTWPINMPTISGEIDGENCAVLFSRNYISNQNLLNEKGYWDIDSANDRFIIDGKIYKSAGDTYTSQASGTGIVFMVILKRTEETNINFVEG